MIHVFNPQIQPISQTSSPALQWIWIDLQGSDAKDFLHRLSTVNVKTMQVGQGSPGCFLTSQGKLKAYFQLWRYSENEFGFEFDPGATQNPSGQSQSWKDSFLGFIEQYTFAEKMTLTDTSAAPGFECRWIFADSPEELPPSFPKNENETLALTNSVRLCRHSGRNYGRTWVTAWGQAADMDAFIAEAFSTFETLGFTEIEKWRIQSMRPRVGHELDFEWMPVEIGLADSIAQNKGCYPGQEVIEKIISLGSPPKRLALLTGEEAHDDLPVPGDLVFNLAEPPAEIGKLTSVCKNPNGPGFLALSVIRKIHAKEGLEVTIKANTNIHAKISKTAPYDT